MTKQAMYGAEPWRLVENRLDLDLLAQSESVFALSNGHIGLRGNLDEGDPHGLPGTYLNSMYEVRPLPVRRGRLRLPGDRAHRHQCHQWQDNPPARAMTNHSTSGTAPCIRMSVPWICGQGH